MNTLLLASVGRTIYASLPTEGSRVAKGIVFMLFLLTAAAMMTILYLVSFAVPLLSRKNKTLTTEHVITLKENGFVEETPYNVGEHTWASVQRLRRSKNYIFIYISAGQAHVIPKRAFGTDEEWIGFYEFCREKTGLA